MKRSPDQTNAADPVIEAYKKHIDRTLIRENLRLSSKTPDGRHVKGGE